MILSISLIAPAYSQEAVKAAKEQADKDIKADKQELKQDVKAARKARHPRP